jgi:hypothetical protein
MRFHPSAGGWHTAAHGTAARTEGVAAAQAFEGGRRPLGGPTWAGVDRELGQHKKNPKENENGLPTRSGPKCELGFRMDFRIDFKDFEFKSKGLNISKANFELRSK